jgi:hypothetical protein
VPIGEPECPAEEEWAEFGQLVAPVG